MSKIDDLVNRFLTWPVPADVYPDGTPGQPGRTGTNLLNALQAKDMLMHVLGDVLGQRVTNLKGPMNASDIEAMSRAKGLTAPRVTPAELRDNIVHTTIVKHIAESGQVLRWAVLTTRSGFAVTGRPSASVSSENDDIEIGERVAIDNATAELWPLMGYALRERLFSA